MTKIWIKDVTYLSGPDMIPVQGDVTILGQRIDRLKPPGDTLVGDWQVIDGKNKLLTPGLVNTHTHVAMTLFRGYGGGQALQPWLEKWIWPAEAKLKDEDVYWGASLGIMEMVACGVTCFADMYDHMDAIGQAVSESGIRANLSRGMIGMNDPHGRGLQENDALFDAWHGAENDRIRVYYGPHAPNTCPPAYLEKVAAHAKEREAGIHIHLSETRQEVDFCMAHYGKSPTQVCLEAGLFDQPCLAAHGVHLSAQDRETLATHQVAIAHNPVSNMKLASGACPVMDLRQRGVHVGIGTDGASSNNNLSVLKDTQITTLMQKHLLQDAQALSAQEAMQMATIDGAKALAWDRDIGSIEAGKKADLVLWDLSGSHWTPCHQPLENLIYAGKDHDVVMTMVDGKILYRDGAFLRVDKETILAKARSAAEAICS